jgi:hypothetical protein
MAEAEDFDARRIGVDADAGQVVGLGIGVLSGSRLVGS